MKATLSLALFAALAAGTALAAGKKKHKAKTDQAAQADHPANDPSYLTLQDVLTRAEAAAPSVAGRRAEEAAAHAEIGIAKAAMLPSVDAQAVDSTGFPGSTGYLGIGGLMGSPYRSGLAGGFVVQQQIYDFGRTDAATRVADEDTEAKRQRTQLEAENVRLAAVRLFYGCAREKSLVSIYKDLAAKTERVTKEVNGFVRTGQRSVVDRYLAASQLEEAKTQQAVAEARLKEAQTALALALGVPAPVACPPLAQAGASWTSSLPPEKNPLVAGAAAALATEQARLDVVKTRYMPKLEAIGTLGMMERSRLVPKQDYALGVGISVPLFEGFKEDYEIERGQALVNSRQYDVDARKLDLAELNARYDEQIAAARTQLDHLTAERQLAKQGFDVARDRYRSEQGTLTDLRDAIRNLSRTDQAYTDAAATELEAVGAKELVNGGQPQG